MRRFLIISLLCGLGLLRALPAAADAFQIQENAPDRYVVVKGDTLWDISGRFLKQPWRWPEIWRLNREQIRNPHWIYPGNVIVLDRNAQPPRLRIEGQPDTADSMADHPDTGSSKAARGSVRLSPQIHDVPEAEAIPSISLRDIQAFMGHPLVVSPETLAAAPSLIGFEGRRDLGSAGDTAFSRGALPNGVHVFQVFRAGPALLDPVSHATLAYRADYVGDVRLTEAGEPARLQVMRSSVELMAGDRLLVPDTPPPPFFVPSAPAQPISGQVIGLPNDGVMTGRNSVVILSRGAQDGLQPGNVLAVYPGTGDMVTHKAPTVALPQTRSGLLFVFRTFDRVSYALVVQSLRPINAFDTFQNP